MDYSKLSDVDINREAAKALKLPWAFNGTNMIFVADDSAIGRHAFDPCNNPADAWPIIVNSRIGLNFVNGIWRAQSMLTGWVEFSEENPLRAAMIVFLMMQEAASVPGNPAGSDIR